MVEMRRRKEGRETGGDQALLPEGVVLRPPATLDDLKADTEYGPEGAKEFAALIRALRQEGGRPTTL